MNKKAKFIYIVAVFIIINTHWGCKRSNIDITFGTIRNIEPQIIDSTLFIGLPIDLKIYHDKLFISDFYGDSLIISYNLNKKSNSRFGKKGEGPHDISAPSILFINDDKLYIYSKNTFKLGYFNISDTTQNYYDYEYIGLMPSLISEVTVLENDRYLASGYFEDGRYAIYDNEGKASKIFGDYPNFLANEEAFSFDVKAMFHQVMFESNRHKEKIIGLSAYIMDVIDVSTVDCNVEKRVLLSDYNYNFHNENYIQTRKNEKTPIGAISISMTQNYIYVLFNPNSSTNLPILNNEIWVFDWNGKPNEKIIPNINLTLIAAASDNTIYGIAQEINDKIYIIKIDL